MVLEGSVALATLTVTADCLTLVNNSGSNVNLIILLSSLNV